jgi:hypothetical protein
VSHHPTNADTDPAAGGERLSAWLDGELTEAEQREFEAELARDPALRADLEALESVVRLVREEAPTVAPPGFHGRVMARVAELEPAPQPGLVAWFTSLGRRWEAIALGGVALAALLLFVPLAQRTPPAEPTDGPPSAGAVKLSAPPTTPDPIEEPNSSVPAPLQAKNARKSSPEVPQTQVVGRARVEGPSDAANTGVQGTNLAWEPQPVEPTPGGTAEEVEVPAASARPVRRELRRPAAQAPRARPRVPLRRGARPERRRRDLRRADRQRRARRHREPGRAAGVRARAVRPGVRRR